MHSWGCYSIAEAHRYLGIPWSQKSENKQISLTNDFYNFHIFNTSAAFWGVLNLLWWSRRQIICNCTFLWTNLNAKASLSSVLMLRLRLVFFFSMSVWNSCFKFSNYERLILKYLKNFCLSSFKRPNGVWTSPSSSVARNALWIQYFRFFRFSSSTRRYSPQAVITSSSQRSTPTPVKSGSSTLQNRRSVKLLDNISDISSYHADFHEGHGTVGAWQGRGMACVN